MIAILQRILSVIDRYQSDDKVTAGFDGFIDTIVRAVRSQTGAADNPDYFREIREFGGYLSAKSNRSCSIQLETLQEKLGGNMPIYMSALSKLGVKTNCVGAMGYPQVSPLFRSMGEHCARYSVCSPGICTAVEFDDGKVMLSNNGEIDQLDYSMLAERLGLPTLQRLFDEASFLTLLNWGEIKGTGSIWEGLLREVLPNCRPGKHLLFDFSDLSSRGGDEIFTMLGQVKRFGDCTRTVLSLNLNEAEQLCGLLKVRRGRIEEMALQLCRTLKAEQVVVHLTDGCLAVSHDEVWKVHNVRITAPVLLTGGGDHFNAGYTFGVLAGLNTRDCLVVANATSGFYVAHGYSPGREELKAWISRHPDYLSL